LNVKVQVRTIEPLASALKNMSRSIRSKMDDTSTEKDDYDEDFDEIDLGIPSVRRTKDKRRRNTQGDAESSEIRNAKRPNVSLVAKCKLTLHICRLFIFML